MVINEKKRAPVGVLIESQAGALTKRKRLDFLWFSWLTKLIIIEKNLLMPWQQLGGDGPSMGHSNAQFAAGVFMGKAPSSLPRADVPQICRIEAGSYQMPRRCLLWTSEIVIHMFTVQEQQPSDPLPTLHRGCTQSWAAALPLGKGSPKGSRGCKRWLLAANPLRSQMKDKRKRKKRASLTSLFPLPFLF